MHVEFEEHNAPAQRKKPTGLVGFLINNGYAKNLSQANFILIAISAIGLIAIASLWFATVEEPTRADLATFQELLRAGHPSEIVD